MKETQETSFDLWVRKVPGGENGNPFQYSCWDNPMDRGALRATVHGVTKSQILLSKWARTHNKTKIENIWGEVYIINNQDFKKLNMK